jgi:hypothetical protein
VRSVHEIFFRTLCKSSRCVLLQASLKIEDSDWSNSFALDAVGTVGIVHCNVKGTSVKVKWPAIRN